MKSLLVRGIGQLVTNVPDLGRGPLGIVENTCIVVAGSRVVAVGGSDHATDHVIDVGGRCVLPGFVDSHTHLIFGGDRSAEFSARMAGRPYAATGIAETIEHTAATSDGLLLAAARCRQQEAHRAGITTFEVKSGYGLTIESEHRLLRIGAKVTEELTYLGAHVVPEAYKADPDGYVDLVCGEMLDACAPHARWIDAFCETGAFDRDQCKQVLLAGRAAGLGLRLHANQLGPGPGVRLGVELGCASVDHCTHLDPADLDALADSDVVATFLPLTDFSTRQPFPDGRAVADAGVDIALATNCNPGSSFTTAMGLTIAFAVRDMHLTSEEAVRASTFGGARALRRTDVGVLRPGSAADLITLGATSYEHLAYRPGVPLVELTVAAGSVVWRAPWASDITDTYAAGQAHDDPIERTRDDEPRPHS